MAAGKGKDEGKRPIIIKKIKKGGHGHHGGAWKVAYADFVTAMMAFFLLLWLLSTSSKAKLDGLAEYFTPTVGIKDSQGIGFKGGTAMSEVGTSKSNMSTPGLVVGQTPTGVTAENPDNPSKSEAEMDDNLFKKGETAISQAVAQDKQLSQFQENISVMQTPEGLKIDVMDTEKNPMFEQGTARLTEAGQTILGGMSKILKKLPNYMALTGHTDASPSEAGRTDYTNWELSSDRAQAARRFLIQSGLEAERPKKVTGMADKELAIPREPRNPRNRRISIIMLRGSHILIPDGAVPPDNGSLSGKPPAEAPAALHPLSEPAANAAPAAPPAAAH